MSLFSSSQSVTVYPGEGLHPGGFPESSIFEDPELCI